MIDMAVDEDTSITMLSCNNDMIDMAVDKDTSIFPTYAI